MEKKIVKKESVLAKQAKKATNRRNESNGQLGNGEKGVRDRRGFSRPKNVVADKGNDKWW